MTNDSDQNKNALHGLPDGYFAVPVSAQQAAASLRICAVVKRDADPVAGRLVLLRDLLDSHVLLGCIVDAGAEVHQWVELWIQSPDALGDTIAICREALSNAVLDDRWRRHLRAVEELEPGAIMRAGWETAHPLPTFLDMAKLEPVHPTDSDTGGHWRLCEDDALLAGSGLPAYATSLHRYLYLPEAGEQTAFVPVTRDAPTNDRTRPLSDLTGPEGELVPLNPAGGLMLVRPRTPIEFEPFLAVLNGEPWEGVLHGRSVLDLGGIGGKLRGGDRESALDGRLFLGARGCPGRLVETFHLKLRLLADAIAAVRSMTYHHQRPLLNVTAESFQIRVADPGEGLPFLWMAKPTLVDPGETVALPIEATDATYYVPGRVPKVSMYRPVSAGPPVHGSGSVRIRKFLPATRDGETILEGTLVTQERVAPGPHDLIWIRLNLSCGRIDLYAHDVSAGTEEKAALAAGETRFRTIGQRPAPETAEALRAAEGVPLPNSPFEIVPLLSTPCDLYSLGVLAVRTLLVDEDTTLPVAIDEVLSLARQAGIGREDAAELGPRIRAVFDADERWGKSLGPQRLTNDKLEAGAALGFVPPELWWDTLAMIIRCFPGMRDSVCHDYGDAQQGGIHKVFDRALSDLTKLILRTRSLVVVDWQFNREVNAVITQFLDRHSGSGGTQASS